MSGYVSAALARSRLYGTLAGAFAALALVLAAIGLYGLIAYTVSRRTHEIRIRLALGAEPRMVLRSTVGQALRLIVPGLALGAGGAVALSRFATALLYGVRENDPLTYAMAAALLAAVAVAAAYLPARKAASIEPMQALRAE